MTHATTRKVRPAASLTQVVLPVVQIKQSHDLALDVDDVGPGGAVAVVPVFDSMQGGDSITLRWLGFYAGSPEPEWTQTTTLTDAGSEQPVLWNIPRGQVLLVKGGYAEISYRLSPVDSSETIESPQQTLQIVPPVSARLDAPVILGHDSSQPLDPGRFPDGVILKIAGYPGMQLDDDVLLYADGTPDDGSVLRSLRIGASHLQADNIEFPIGPEWLRANQGAQVRVVYQYARPGAALTSEPLVLSVLEPLDLPPPRVEKAVAEGEAGQNKGYLLGQDATSGVYVRAHESVPLGSNDHLEVHWHGHPSGGQYIAQSPVNPDDRKRFLVPASAVAANMGGENKRFEVFYRFTPFRGHAQDSRPFQLRIQPLDQARYPIIQWDRLAGAPTLSLKTVAATGEPLRLDAWPFMAEGQRVTIEATGVATVGEPARVIVRDALPVVHMEMMERKVVEKLPLNFLRSLRLNEHITLNARVSFDGGQSQTYFRSNGGVRLLE